MFTYPNFGIVNREIPNRNPKKTAKQTVNIKSPLDSR